MDKTVADIIKEVLQLFPNQIRSLLLQLSELRNASVLLTDYELKEIRQQHHNEKQNKVIVTSTSSLMLHSSSLFFSLNFQGTKSFLVSSKERELFTNTFEDYWKQLSVNFVP